MYLTPLPARMYPSPNPFLSNLISGLTLVISLTTVSLAAQDNTPSPTMPPGFLAERLYSVPAEQGSWVSMTSDRIGRLIVSDQYGSLYRVTADVQPVKVEKLDLNIGFAQGLLYAFDSLYVVAHPSEYEFVDTFGERRKESRAAGLYRLRDTNNDDQYDEIKLLRQFEGEGEHGPHAVILSPDGRSLYVCAGNHTKIPNPEYSRVPSVWQEDQTTPRLPDAGGHADGILAPGGWICKTDPDGSQFELVSVGFRNQYDIAFAPDGELFTYDADMEWDIGLPWYRPTRICHVTSGSEFGWRNGSGKWPSYFPDNLPAAVEIGPGSPTGIAFGTGAKFPAEYQNSLFIADWSYGIIYRVQLESSGATFKGIAETFCTSPALPVTDLIINSIDGAMYFLTGGRRSQSELYRVTYRGNELTEPATYPATDPLVAIRRKLEDLHVNPSQENVENAWPMLAHNDRFVRFAARTAIELVPGNSWYRRALEEPDVQARLEALLALVRTANDGQLQAAVVQSLGQLDFETLREEQQLHLLRLYGLVMTRMGEPQIETLRSANALSRYYPASSERVNRELSRVLAASQAEDVVAKSIDLIENAGTQEQQIHYAMVIHAVQAGWTDALRERYLQWFITSAKYAGGSSFRKYLANIRSQFAAFLTDDQKNRLKPLLLADIEPVDPYAQLRDRPTVKQWTMDDLTSLSVDNGDINNGEKMFALAQCYSCHIINRQGGIVGPDLTNAGRRLNTRDLLETIIDPDKAISDQYQATVFQLDDGRTIVGRTANRSGNVYLVQEDMIRPGELTRIESDQIDSMRPSKLSMMPAGLLDTLNRDEIRDLLAYLKSAAGSRQ